MGFHFRTACELGKQMGYAVSEQIVRSTLQPSRSSGLINLAVRGRVGAGEDTLIAGFNIAAGSRHTLIRAVGPGLAALGIKGVLADPKLALFDSAGRIVAENDDWSAGDSSTSAEVTAAAAKAGAWALPIGSRDAAVMATLPAGTYTIHATGAPGASGVALLELFEVP